MQTHEAFIHAIVGLAKARLNEADCQLIDDAKITYGAGNTGTRGVTYFGTWENGGGPDKPHSFVEICAFGESDPVQIAGTTLHELAHVISGFEAGHGTGWKDTCRKVGLRVAKAAGQSYCMAYFSPDIRFQIAALKSPNDGRPIVTRLNGFTPKHPRPCGAVIGVRGGKSRGTGSGSRLKKVACGSCGYVARVTAKWIDQAGPPLCPCNREQTTTEQPSQGS